ncbi:MAG: hypothetical protein U0232_01940 [Thermomicrobiales bacterium]
MPKLDQCALDAQVRDASGGEQQLHQILLCSLTFRSLRLALLSGFLRVPLPLGDHFDIAVNDFKNAVVVDRIRAGPSMSANHFSALAMMFHFKSGLSR